MADLSPQVNADGNPDHSPRLISVTVASIPLAIVNLKSTRWPGAMPRAALGFASLNVILMAGQFALATGP